MNILDTIGNTPMIRLNNIPDKNGAAVYVKLEYFNPTASYKDRMAKAAIEEAEKRGELTAQTTIVENTAGSTGTSLAFVCAVKGYAFKAVSSNAFSQEKLRTMQLFGAQLELVDDEGMGINPALVPKMIARASALSQREGYYWTRQFENEDILKGYSQMAYEIVEQAGKPIHTFCAGVGTAGMFTGVAKQLQTLDSNIKVVALEPASAPLLTKGIKGTHHIEGIAPGFEPPFLQYIPHYSAMAIEEADARLMTRRLAKEEGIFAGISSGLNVTAAVAIAKQLSPDEIVVTVACDSGMKYFSTDLFPTI